MIPNAEVGAYQGRNTERDREASIVAGNRGSVAGGTILVMLGIAFLAMQLLGEAAGSFVLLGLGVAFLVSHAYYGSYGFLVPGGILTGLGLGVLAEEVLGVGGEPVVLGLGLGFVLVWAVDRLITHKGPETGAWWPLIPGGILTLVGLASLFPDLSDAVLHYTWPIAIIVLGAVLIARGLRGRNRT